MHGNVKIKIQTRHPAIAALFSAIATSGMRDAHVARRAGISANALVDWKKMHDARITNLEACLNVVGLRLVVVPLEMTTPPANDP
jgi:hypothetical protein